MIQVYTGNGKGKTTAALGLALRAAGAGLRVYIGQFVKQGTYSESAALKKHSNITVEQFGAGCFIKGSPTAADRQRARAGFDRVKAVLAAGKHRVVILDEINCVVSLGMLAASDVLTLMRRVPPCVELVLTGRNCHASVIKEADLVTSMQEKKHYFTRGFKARKGIEF